MLLQVWDTADPEFFNTPIIPKDFFDPPHDDQNAEPLFSEVDNPCGWINYYFCPNFSLIQNRPFYK